MLGAYPVPLRDFISSPHQIGVTRTLTSRTMLIQEIEPHPPNPQFRIPEEKKKKKTPHQTNPRPPAICPKLQTPARQAQRLARSAAPRAAPEHASQSAPPAPWMSPELETGRRAPGGALRECFGLWLRDGRLVARRASADCACGGPWVSSR